MSPGRSRWPGFVITDSEQDQAIDRWLDEAAAQRINVSQVVKDHLYQVATGESATDPAIQQILDRLSQLDRIEGQLEDMKRELRRIAAGAPAPAQPRELPPEEKRKETARKLGSMMD